MSALPTAAALAAAPTPAPGCCARPDADCCAGYCAGLPGCGRDRNALDPPPLPDPAKPLLTRPEGCELTIDGADLDAVERRLGWIAGDLRGLALRGAAMPAKDGASVLAYVGRLGILIDEIAEHLGLDCPRRT